MRPLDNTRTAAEVLVDQLMINGVSRRCPRKRDRRDKPGDDNN
jgi:hypothetical protein